MGEAWTDTGFVSSPMPAARVEMEVARETLGRTSTTKTRPMLRESSR
ncbi:hypothetical protein SAMN05660976_00624 [Nonomuraea pusilla]|uniref:Uncharacterized protein n=1 Tax=Nonomuraea pusilla TaxID=46177 RepID=A0A1H7HXV5_9ACTN|nr:hypothetical protein SAMN05660976_00624 [Nonomuraea pusilla]